MSKSFLTQIQQGVITNSWRNGMVGQFEYLPGRACHRFIETTDNPYAWIIPEQDRNDTNTPVVMEF